MPVMTMLSRSTICLLVLAVLLGLGQSSPGRAQPATTTADSAAADARTGEQISHHQLANGLELLLKPEPGHASVSLQFWYQVGARDETPSTQGYAHLLELLMYGGTDSVASFEREIARLGGQTGSATWPDVTLFYVDVPASGMRRALELEADRMLHLRLASGPIQATAQSISFEVARLIQNTPESFLQDRLRALAFAGHPYAHPAVGMPGSTTSQDSTSCREFYQRFYRPDNVCLVVAGGFEPAALLAMAEEILAPLTATQPAPALDRSLPELPAPSTRRESFDLGEPMSRLAIAYPLPGEAADDRTRTSLRLLSRYMNGPGLEACAEGLLVPGQPPQLLQISIETTLDQHAGLLVVNAALVDNADVGAIERQLVANLANLGARLATASSYEVPLPELRQQELFGLLAAQNTVAARASVLAKAHILQGDFTLLGRERELLEAVTREDLSRVAGYLQPAKAVVIQAGAGI